jgi:hypothetical protein
MMQNNKAREGLIGFQSRNMGFCRFPMSLRRLLHSPTQFLHQVCWAAWSDEQAKSDGSAISMQALLEYRGRFVWP